MEDSEDAAAIRELAERLLAVRVPSLSPESQPSPLLVGQLPDGLPLEVPLPDGARIVGSVVRRLSLALGAPPGGVMADIVLDAPGAAEGVLQFYDRALTDLGWSAAQSGMPPRRMGGFVPFQTAPSHTFCQGPNGPWLSVNVQEMRDGTNDVRIHVDAATPGPCAAPPHDFPGRSVLPALTPPTGVALRQLGGGGGSGMWSSTALALGDQTASALEAHFAQQLQADGWVRGDGGVDGRVAWSRWTSSAHENWTALLLVVEEPAPNQRFLHVRAELAGGGQGPWSGWLGGLQSFMSYGPSQPFR